MSLLIDGHNLIGAQVFDDIRLSDEDDEAKLVARLKVWRSRTRGKITVIFDRGIPGGIDVKMGGAGVEVIFAADPAQADDLIRRRLRQAKPGLTLVTNDDELARTAAAYRVDVLRGEEFVQRMQIAMPDAAEPGTEDDVRLSKAEVEEWLALFGGEPTLRRKRKRRPAPSLNDKPPKPKPRTNGSSAAPRASKPPVKPPAKPPSKSQSKPPSKLRSRTKSKRSSGKRNG